MKVKKVLLAMLPYWSPVIPPVGLSTLKSYLEPHGCEVRTIDFNSKIESLSFYYDYLGTLQKNIPAGKRGTFYNMGHEVLEKHLIAFQKYKDKKKYYRLVKLLIFNTYYVEVNDRVIDKLDKVIARFLDQLWKYFLFLFDYEQPEVLGVTLYKTTLPLSLYILKQTKAFFPQMKTAAGGGIFADLLREDSPNFSAFMNETAGYLDKVFIGHSEVLFYKYLMGEFPEAKRVFSPRDLEPHEILRPEHNPLPDFSDFNIKKYSHLVATGSFGCPYSCSFCNEKLFFGKFKKRDPGKIIADMMTLYQRHQRKLFFMTDSLLNPVIDDLATEILNHNAPFYMDTYFRVDNASADLERTLYWRRGGLYRVRLGLESGSDRILELMNKGITVALTRAALPKLAMAGIKTTTYWLMGHPSETEEDFQKTLDLVEELKDYIWQAECNGFRYYWGAHNSDDLWKEYRVPLYPEELQDMLIFKTYTLDREPSRKEAYDRVFRFINHCKKLGIPNPYSGYEGFEADQRWKTLHKNCVPTIEEMESHNFCDKRRETFLVNKEQNVDKDFNF